MNNELIQEHKAPTRRRISVHAPRKSNSVSMPSDLGQDLDIMQPSQSASVIDAQQNEGLFFDQDIQNWDDNRGFVDIPTPAQVSDISQGTSDEFSPDVNPEYPPAINQMKEEREPDGEYQYRRSFSRQSTMRPRRHYSRYQGPQQYQDNEEDYRANAPVLYVNDFNTLNITQLREKAQEAGIDAEMLLEMRRQEIITAILKKHAFSGGVIHASGTLEILQDGYGFLRSELNSYLQGPEDVFVSPQIIKSNSLRTGDNIYCMLRNPRASERFFAVYKILKVNGEEPSKAYGRIPFDSLTPLYPDTILKLEGKNPDLSMRVIDMFSPIGKGQRALITAPPKTGKTILLQKIANAITDNYPEIKLMVLLVDERPEEVTDMRRNVKGEVVASTFDEQAQRHVNVAEMVIEKAKRYVEYGHDVVILLDSITRLARAYNQTAPTSGKVLSGGVDSNALHKPKRFFGAARNIENGGSLTIIATALIETGSRMDEVIFEEFKGTGNCEIVLDRKMAEKRVYPAVNLKKSGTRREELLIDSAMLARIWALRNALNSMDDVEMSELILEKMKKSESNEMFMKAMSQVD